MSEQFNPADLTKAVADVQTAFAEMKSANDQKLKEIEEKGTADPLLGEKIERIESDLSAAQKKLDDYQTEQARRRNVVTDEKGNAIDLDAKAESWAKIVGKETGFAGEFKSEQMDAYKSAFMKLVRSNFNENFLDEKERKALSVGSQPDGGYFVYPDMSGRMVQKIFETSAVRAYASVQVISTDSLEGYYDNDETGFGWVSELESRPATSTPQVGKWAIPTNEMYAMPRASQKILDDAAVDMENWLEMKIADRFARAENAAFVAGDGVERPRGFITYPDGTDLTNSVERINTGVDGDFAATPNGGDKLITALYKLKAQYRANATWFMNRTTTGAVRLLKDSDGAYIWTPGIAAGQPASLLGYPVADFEDMPDIATGSVSIAVGDLRQAYQIVDRAGIRMLRDPYTSKPNVLFYATKRTGGDMINGEALKLIEFSAA